MGFDGPVLGIHSKSERNKEKQETNKANTYTASASASACSTSRRPPLLLHFAPTCSLHFSNPSDQGVSNTNTSESSSLPYAFKPMPKDKKDKREEKMKKKKKKGMLQMKPENKFKKRKAFNEGGVNLAMDESERGPAVVKEKGKKKKGKDQIIKKKAAQSNSEKQELKVKKDIHSQPEKKVSKTKISEKSSDMDEENAEEISSVDEDCSRGMKKWLIEYKESRPGIDVLQQRIDDFITDHEAKLEQEKQEREAAAAEGGWTVVVHQKGRKKTTDAESGISVGSVAPASVLDKMSKKKSKESTMDFYRFQRREAQRSEIMMLQEKFEQDKKRIQQLRAARKFRPY